MFWFIIAIGVTIGIIVASYWEDAGYFFMIAGAGIAASFIIKFFMRVGNSYKILQTIYLKQIRDKIDNLKK